MTVPTGLVTESVETLAEAECPDCGHSPFQHHIAGGCTVKTYGPPEEGFYPAKNCTCDRAADDALIASGAVRPAAEVRAEARDGRCHPLCGTPDRHPEDFCHRCGGPNISWYTPGGVWDPVMRPVPGAPWKWHEIICPPCFVELAGGGTWALIPRKDDGERWTSADERTAIAATIRAALAVQRSGGDL